MELVRSGGDRLANHDTNEDRKSVLLGGSDGEIISIAWANCIYSSTRPVDGTGRTTLISIDPEPLVPVVLGSGHDGIPVG